METLRLASSSSPMALAQAARVGNRIGTRLDSVMVVEVFVDTPMDPDRQVARIGEKIREGMVAQQNFSVEMQCAHRNGHRYCLSMNFTPVFDEGNRLTDIVLQFEIAFPAGEAGDAARTILPSAVQRSHDRLCTVSRTVELGTPVSIQVE